MTDSDRKVLLNRTAKHEGLRLKVYADPVGILTIGYGRNLEGKGISQQEAQLLLQHDLADAERDCRESFEWFDDLNGPRQTVLIEMCFNLGPTKLRGFGRTLKAMKEGRYADAASHMLQSKWAAQVKERAVLLSDVMRSGAYA